MKKLFIFSFLGLLFFIPMSTVQSQDEGEAVTPSKIIRPVHHDVLQSLGDVTPVQPGIRDMSWKEKEIKNKENFMEEFQRPSKMNGPDPVLQQSVPADRTDVTIDQNFGGNTNLSGVAPPDTDGDVGPNEYFQMVNLAFSIYDKSGTVLYGPADIITLWDGFTGPWSSTNDGDPVVLYDEYTDRWIATQFALPNYPNGPFYELIAVSQTGDPTGAWNRYAYSFDNMPDYPKFGIWPDGYYFSINQFAPPDLNFAGAGICAVDRTAMINGDSDPAIVFFSLSTSYAGLLPADADGTTQPPSGDPCYFISLGTNSLNIWEVAIDWSDPNSSTATLESSLSTASFSYSGILISQPGTSTTLDALSDRLMFRMQYRNFSDHQSMVVNHTVNAGSGRAGVRWYELRNTGSGWNIYQQGTYAPADGNGRWMGSIAMNDNGDIALGYSVSGSSTYPSIRIAGQTAGAPEGLGVLDIAETSILEGTASQTGVNRWGDYSAMTVDPSDDSTFWYTQEYSTGGWNWETQIASFSFAPPVPGPPVADFTADKTTTVVDETVSLMDMSTNIPTNWFWSFNPANVNYVGGTSSTSQNPMVQFTATGSYEVSLYAENDYGNDTEIKSNYITVSSSPTYCTASGGGDEYISGVEIGTINNTGTGEDGYVDYTNLSTDLNLLTSYDISITNGNPYLNDDLGIWIDWNHDGDFYDTDENVVCTVNDGADGTYSFAVPAFALLGNTTMRIRIKYTYSGDCGDPCGTTTYGEVEDYTVNILPGSVTWNGTTSSDWSEVSNWSIGEVPTGSFNVTIPSSPSGGNFPEILSGTNANTYDLDIETGANLDIFGYLEVEGTLTNNAGTTGLVIKSNASETGSLITSTNNVDATVERYLVGDEWHLVTASTDNQTIESLYFNHNPDVWLKEYDEGSGASGSWSYLSPLNTLMSVGKGFAVWVDDGYNVTPSFEGHLRSNDLTISSLDWTDVNHGYNLIGNPFSSAIDWDQGGWSKVNVEGSIWVYDPATGNYKTRNDHGIGSLSDGIVPVSGGFFVRTLAAGGSITIPTLARVHNNQPYYSPEDNNEDIQYVTIKVSDENNKSDEVWLSFSENCSNDFDTGWDVVKLFGENNKSPQLYSLQNDYKLSINALQQLPEEELQVDLSLDPGISGNHTLELTGYSLPEGTTVFLEDKLAGGSYQDLITNPAYVFHANSWDIKDRFILHFNPEITGNEENSGDLTTTIYANGKNIYINHKSQSNNAIAEVYDLMGRLITAKELGTDELNTIKVNTNNSHLIIRLTDGNQIITKKVFIK